MAAAMRSTLIAFRPLSSPRLGCHEWNEETCPPTPPTPTPESRDILRGAPTFPYISPLLHTSPLSSDEVEAEGKAEVAVEEVKEEKEEGEDEEGEDGEEEGDVRWRRFGVVVVVVVV